MLLRLAMALGALFGVVGTGVGLWSLLSVALSGGPFRFGEDLVPKDQFISVAVPFLVLYVCACITAGLAAWAILRRRARSRVLLTALLGEFVVGDAAMLLVASSVFGIRWTEVAASAVFFTGLTALALWYLFRKRSVALYYASIPE